MIKGKVSQIKYGIYIREKISLILKKFIEFLVKQKINVIYSNLEKNDWKLMDKEDDEDKKNKKKKKKDESDIPECSFLM